MSLGLSIEVIPIIEIPADTRALPYDPQRPVILVVDDERLIADTLTAVLRQNGFGAMAAYDGPSALQLTTVTPPQLLITDIAMPGMNGIQLALAIVHALPPLKSRFSSVHAPLFDQIEVHRAGYHFPMLAKSVHPSDMLQHVQESLKLPPQQPS